MGFFSKLFGGTEDLPIVARGQVVTIRRAEIAALMKRPTDPNFAIASMTEPCDKCGKPFVETFITTGGAHGDETVWREHPIAVDGWACVPCGNFRYPRKVEPARIHDLTEEGARKGRSGDYAGAELVFARIVWNWPGYFPGHVNFAEAIRSRLQAEDPKDPAIERTLVRRMIEQYEAAIAAYATQPAADILPALARAYASVATHAIRTRAIERALRWIDEGLAIEGFAETDRAELEALRVFIAEGRERFDPAQKLLMPYLRLQDRPAKSMDTEKQRKQIGEAMQTLTELVADAPTFWQAAWVLAKAKEAVGDVDGALATFRVAHAKHPDAEPIAKDFSMMLLHRNELAEAVEVARTICAKHPNAPNLCNLAVALILSGDLDAADVALRKSTELDPGDPIARAVESRLAKYRSGAKLPRTMRELERG